MRFLPRLARGDFEGLLKLCSIRTSCSVPMPGRGANGFREAETAAPLPWPTRSRGALKEPKPAPVEGELALTVIFGGRLRIVLGLDRRGRDRRD